MNHPRLRTLAILTLGALVCLLPTKALVAQELSRHPYIQMTTEDSASILWRTVGGTIPIVRYGIAPGVLDYEILPVQTVVRLGPDVPGPAGLPRLAAAPAGTYQYETTIFGLQPGTKYYYGVYDDDVLLAGDDEEHFFNTAPQTGAPVSLRLWVVGDSGNGSEAQIAGFDAMRNFVEADGKPVDAYLHLGDMAYNVGADDEFTSNFFDIYTKLLRNTVVWPTLGNHEGARSSGLLQVGPYFDAYAVPTHAEAGGVESGTEAYYSFDLANIHFICLDSHDLDRSETGDMALWLKEDLEMANADWLIAFWHHPPYTKGTHDSDREPQLIEMREFIMPILESAGVDLVLGGHSHIYERSMLVDGAYATPTVVDGVVLDDGDGDPAGDGAYRKSSSLNPNEGTVAVVAGNGRSATPFFGVSPIMRSTVAEVGSLLLDVQGETLTGRMLNVDGLVRDTFQVVKQGQVQPELVEYPWRPIGPTFVVERSGAGEPWEVEIQAVPAAPDAEVLFTLDGSFPAEGAPVYEGKFALESGQLLSAISKWNAGSRISPNSLLELPGDHVSVQRYIATGADDGRQAADGTVDLGGQSLPMDGEENVVGLRFTGIEIPEDAYIVRAQIQFESAAAELFSTVGAIWGEGSGSAAPFTGEDGDFSMRPRTAAEVRWTPGGWRPGERSFSQQTTDLRTIIEEIVSRGDWQSGNPIALFVEHQGRREAAAIESGRQKAAALQITYIERDGLVEELGRQQLKLDRGANGDVILRFRWPVSDAEVPLGLSLSFEGSRDLQVWGGVLPVAVQNTRFYQDGFREVSVLFSGDQFPVDAADFFLRLRVYQSPP